MRQRQSGATERATVLEELVRRHEGLSAGVKEVLQRAANHDDPVFRNVCGLVADLFHVSVETAPLVEIALGQTAQHVVAPHAGELLSYLQAESNRLGGRVGFVWLDGEKGFRGQGPEVSGQTPAKLKSEIPLFPRSAREHTRQDAPRPLHPNTDQNCESSTGTQSVLTCVPTQSVGTRAALTPGP